MTARLSRAGYRRARQFLDDHGRPVDAALARFIFGEGGADEVLAALALFQNPDGGFGHGLEPDLPTPASTAIVTSEGLRILRRVGAHTEHAMARAALGWLAANFDAAAGVWPIITAEVALAPHAFWWDWDADLAGRWNGFRFNPSAELLGDLYAYRAVAAEAVIARAEAALLAAVAASERLESAYDIKALARLVETEQAPSGVRAAARTLLEASLAALDPEDPHATPLDLTPLPRDGAPVRLSPRLETALDRLILAQTLDGSWRPFWDWSAVDAEAWRAAERAWRGVLTRQALETLAAYGRIEGL